MNTEHGLWWSVKTQHSTVWMKGRQLVGVRAIVSQLFEVRPLHAAFRSSREAVEACVSFLFCPEDPRFQVFRDRVCVFGLPSLSILEVFACVLVLGI